MSRIDREDVERVASLARLRLDADEAAAMTADLDRILDYVDQLEEVPVEGIEPTSQVIPLETPLRADEPGGELPPDVAVANAPAAEGTAFSVPKVVDGEAEGW